MYLHKLDLFLHAGLRDPGKPNDVLVVVGRVGQGQTVLTLNDLGVPGL